MTGVPTYDGWSHEDLYFTARGRNLDVAPPERFGAPKLAEMLREDDERREDPS